MLKSVYYIAFIVISLCNFTVAKTVLITGANQGISFEFVNHYLKEGYRVYATYRSPEKPQDLLALQGENLVPIQVDFED